MADTGKDAGMEERGRGIFGGRREQGRTLPVEGRGGGPARGAEGSLPELKLTQAVKSPEPIVKVEPTKPITSEDGIIQPYRDYTIVLAKDAKEIQILDKQGRKIEGLTNTSTMIFDWSLYKKGQVTHFTDKYQGSWVKKIDTFSKHQQGFLKDFYEKNREGNPVVEMPNTPFQIETSQLRATKVVTGNGYFVVYQDGSKGFIAFKTQNQQGAEIPPRNWTRFDSLNS